MPEITIAVGSRSYTVACQAGEEEHLKTAAGMLDTEAQTVLASGAKIPEAQLLLMAGLMLADKIGSDAEREAYADEQITDLTKKLRSATAEAGKLRHELDEARQAPAENAQADTAVLEKMAIELERLADEMEAANG